MSRDKTLGRPRVEDESLRRVKYGVRLPRWLIRKLRNEPGSQGAIIEAALRSYKGWESAWRSVTGREPTGDETMQTKAQWVADQLDNDGARWCTKRGILLPDLCDLMLGEKDVNGESWTYTFPDGSSITGNDNGWYLGDEAY